MPCSSPIKGYWSRKPHPVTGNRYVVFSPRDGYVEHPVLLPCGKCITCRLARSFQWSVRCTCESYFHKENYFLSLSYDAEHLPEGSNLKRLDFQLFMKRLRKHFTGYKIKVFYCGEYGERRGRPHYHAIIFGLPLQEKNYRLLLLNYSRKGHPNYVNPVISRLWGKGLVTIGSFSSCSAAYVAQYCIKKQKHNDSICNRVKPFIGMSLRSPIGYTFFKKYFKDIFLRGRFNFISNDKRIDIQPFRFFKEQLRKEDPFLYWKFVERPRRRFLSALKMDQALKPEKFAAALDRKIFNRYIKEQKLMRNLQERMDI